MIEVLRRFFELNSILVLFVYGQVFFVLGLAIAFQSRRHSRLQLARSLGWLAAFGIAHGLHEWGRVFIPIQAAYVAEPAVILMQILQVVLLALSFGFLFQFGVETLRERWPHLVAAPLVVMVAWGLWFIMPGLALRNDQEVWRRQAAIWARYLIGFPGGLAAAFGLRYQAERHIKALNLTPIYRTLRVAGLALGAYAVLGGLIVPPGDFFPANWLNDARVIALLGIPAPVFRSIAGLVLAVAIIRALEVFDLEIDRLIENMEMEQGLAAERERIGRELHDGVIQTVYTAGLLVEAARKKLPADAPTGRRLDRALVVLNDAIAALRAYIGGLRPGSLDLTLAASLRAQTADPGLTSLMDVELELAFPEDAPFNATRLSHVQAILSEALSNAARHANARRVHVQAARRDGRLEITVADDGRGFASTLVESGYGLRNMRDRARLLGGQLTVESEPGRGTRVMLIVPWEEA